MKSSLSSWRPFGQNLTSAGECVSFSSSISADGDHVVIVRKLGGGIETDKCSECPSAVIQVWDYQSGEKGEWVQAGGEDIDFQHVYKTGFEPSILGSPCLCLSVVSMSMSADGNRLVMHSFLEINV